MILELLYGTIFCALAALLVLFVGLLVAHKDDNVFEIFAQGTFCSLMAAFLLALIYLAGKGIMEALG